MAYICKKVKFEPIDFLYIFFFSFFVSLFPLSIS